MNVVTLRYCKDYDVGRIEAALKDSLSLLGIDLAKEVAGKKVLLKPNMLNAHHPAKAVTTYPRFVEAVIRVFKDCDCKLWLGDSPNGVQKSIEDVWQVTGMDEVCQRYGVVKKIFEKEGAAEVGGIFVSNVVLEADYVVNLPKFKTHSLTVITGAVKNMFGVVPGLRKAAYHRETKTRSGFAGALVRIAEARRPDLNIVDGIVAMAGNGPSSGYPVRTGAVVTGRDMHAVDHFLANFIKAPVACVDTLMEAEKMGLIDLGAGYLLLGDSEGDFDMSGFRLPVTCSANVRDRRWFNFLVTMYMGWIRVRPAADRKKCIGCRMCEKICPVSAIDFCEGFPRIRHDICIECYCCHEACPEKAMDLKESLALRISKLLSSRR